MEAGRPVRELLQTSRQEMLGTWTRWQQLRWGEMVIFSIYFEGRADRVFGRGVREREREGENQG